jgi:radical SAM protein (TIGR01212 family)
MYWYHTLNGELRRQFGCKLYKLALSGGMTCPNRDGTCGTGGCAFCSGSGEFAAPAALPVPEQLARAKRLVAAKNPGGRYIAYFQDHTNTYAPVSYLEPLFRAAISDPEVAVLSVATRPDCLPEDVLELLSRLNEEKPVWVELGLQTAREDTARAFNRGYALPVYDEAMRQLKARGIPAVVHMILGLPGETAADMEATARCIARSGALGVKLQLLHVLRGTPLAADWAAGRVETLSLEDYITLLERCLRVLPPEIVVHRLTGDGDKKTLLAPLWSADKKRVLNEIRRRFDEDSLVQGSEA